MKLSLSKNSAARGSAMVVVLVIGTLMLLSLAGYLTLVNHQNYMSIRSQAWNTSIAVVEAGIEEALEHLNANRDYMGTDGWGSAHPHYVLDYDLGDGTGYSVSINMTDPEYPEIISQAFSTLDGAPIEPIFGALGVTPRTTLSRAVKVHASRGGLLIKGLVAKYKIEMNGNNIRTDSYDSGDPNKSTGSRYDPAKAGANGDVAVNSSIQDAIGLGNANIFGHASTGPRGTISMGPNGGIGDQSWVAANPGKIQEGWLTDDMNFTFPEPELPFTTGLPAPGGDVVTVETIVTKVERSGVPQPGDEGVVTNVSYTYFPTHPGPLAGLTTNLTWQITQVPPDLAKVFGLITTNYIARNSQTWPGSSVGLITTNTQWESSTTYPADKPFVLTNWTSITEVSLPSPLPPGPITTNTTIAKSDKKPEGGTYLGNTWNVKGWWYCNQIIGYTWRVREYFWPLREYYWTETQYAFQEINYALPNFTYDWNDFTTNYVYTTNHYDHILNTGQYVVTTLSGTTYVAGDAELVVLNDIKMHGTDSVVIAPNAKLHAYVDGVDSAIGGGSVVNMTGLAEKCIIEFTKDVRNLSFSGNGEFVGVIIAPDTNIEMDGGGKAITDFCGAAIGHSIGLRGHFKFHYDEALARLTPSGRYLVRTWDEVDANTALSSIAVPTAPTY